MKKTKPTLTTQEAVELAKKEGLKITKPTVITWVEKFGLGKRFIGKWYIDKKKFLDFLDKQWTTHAGKYKKK